MLWFARSLETAPDNASDLQRAIRANLGAWYEPGARLRTVLTGVHNVSAVAMSTDGKTLFTAHQSEMRVWDVATGAPIGEPIRPKTFQRTESFSPDGRPFAVGGTDPSSDVTAVIWDTSTRKPIRSLRVPPEDFRKGGFFNPNAQKTAFSPNGKVLVTTNYRSVHLWDVATGRPIGPTFRRSDDDPVVHKDWIEALALSPDGKVLATGSRDSTARLWDATTGLPLGEPLPHDSWVRSLAFSPDGKTLVSGGFGGTASVWEVATGKRIGAPIIHRGYIYAVAFSPDGRFIMTAAGDVMRQDGENSARLWDAVTHKPIGMALNHDHYVEAVAFSPDGKSAVTSGGSDVCVWDLPESQPAERILRHGGPVVSVAFSPTAAWLPLRVLSSSRLNSEMNRKERFASGRQERENPWVMRSQPPGAFARCFSVRTVKSSLQ
jgi:WD40 repeat protein